MFKGRPPDQGSRHVEGIGQQVPYENQQQQMPSPVLRMGGSLGTAEAGHKQVGTSSVGEALGGPGVEQDDHEPIVCPDKGKWHLGIYCQKNDQQIQRRERIFPLQRALIRLPVQYCVQFSASQYR